MTSRAGRGAPLGEVLRLAFTMAGLGAVYGEPFAGLGVVEAGPGEAALLAAAHARIHGIPAVTHGPPGRFVLGRQSATETPAGDPAPPLVLDDPSSTAALLEQLFARCHQQPDGRPTVLEVAIGADTPVDLGGSWPLPPPPDQLSELSEDVVARLDAATAPVLVAGPGVLRHAAGLHAAAAAANVGVLNTWGAKGVFDWRSRYHWATVGLQQRDLALGGLGPSDDRPAADLVVATGLDPAETPADLTEFAPVVTVPPAALDGLSERWNRPAAPLAVPPLRSGLAAVTQQGWARSGPPLAPSQVTRNYGRLTAGRGLVAADPGVAGFWVARTFPTTVLGEALVPGDAGLAGFAVACALVAWQTTPGRPVLAVVDAPAPDAVGALLERARALGVPVVLEVWDPEGPSMDHEQHLDRLTAAMWSSASSGSVTELRVATDPEQRRQIEEVAGPVVAWCRPAGTHD